MKIEELLSRIIVGAIDPDWRVFQRKVFQDLTARPEGQYLLVWARSNPLAFEAFVRSISAYAHVMSKDDSLLREKTSDFLKQIAGDAKWVYPAENASRGNRGMDAKFRSEYEAAIDSLNAADLNRVASLSPSQLQEWVDAPAKIRPAVLDRMCAPSPFRQGLNDFIVKAGQRSEARVRESEKTLLGWLSKKLIR